MKDKPKHPGGRPTTYTLELASKVLEAISISDKGLNHICNENDDFPAPSTVYKWKLEHKEFSEKYFSARQSQAEVYAESTIEIAREKPYYVDEKGIQKIDGGYVAWQRLNVGVRQWHASKLAPKIYGDQKQVEELTADKERLKQELLDLRAQLDKKNKKSY